MRLRGPVCDAVSSCIGHRTRAILADWRDHVGQEGAREVAVICIFQQLDL
jgi:hypothetical protein